MDIEAPNLILLGLSTLALLGGVAAWVERLRKAPKAVDGDEESDGSLSTRELLKRVRRIEISARRAVK